MCGYLFSNLFSEKVNEQNLYVTGVGIVYVYAIVIYIFGSLIPKGYFTSGSQPKDLFVQDFFNVDDDKVSLMYLYSKSAKGCRQES